MELKHVSEDHAAWYRKSLGTPDLFWSELARARLRWTREFDRVPPKDTFYKDHEAASCGRAHACFCLVKFAQLLFI